MSRIAHGRARAKSRAPQTKPCFICKQEHPEDQTNHRMVEHAHQGRRCLGGDIPFERHGEKPMGKLMGCIVSQVPWPNRARAIQLADGYFTPDVIARVAAEPAEHDHHPLWWLERMMWHAGGDRLKRDIEAAQRRPRLVERRAT